jgi:hypothetical protein
MLFSESFSTEIRTILAGPGHRSRGGGGRKGELFTFLSHPPKRPSFPPDERCPGQAVAAGAARRRAVGAHRRLPRRRRAQAVGSARRWLHTTCVPYHRRYCTPRAACHLGARDMAPAVLPRAMRALRCVPGRAMVVEAHRVALTRSRRPFTTWPRSAADCCARLGAEPAGASPLGARGAHAGCVWRRSARRAFPTAVPKRSR